MSAPAVPSPPRPQRTLWERLQWIDRRWLFLLLVLVMAVPTLFPFPLPVFVFDDTLGLYRTIEKIPPDKLVLLMADWGGGTKGENWPQTEAVIRHMLKRGVKFAIMGIDPMGPEFAQRIAEDLASQYGRHYGQDWVNFGYKPLTAPMIISFARDVRSMVEQDIFGTPIDQVPLIRKLKVKDMSAFALVYAVAASPTIESWIGLVQPRFHTPMACGVTAVCAPELYPYLDSGQLCGMLVGMRGGAEYEKLVGKPGRATTAMSPLSLSHLLIIVLVILGNIGYWAERRRRRRPARR